MTNRQSQSPHRSIASSGEAFSGVGKIDSLGIKSDTQPHFVQQETKFRRIKSIIRWIKHVGRKRKRDILDIVRLIPVSSKFFGPPKGFYWTVDQYIEKTQDTKSLSIETYPPEAVNLWTPAIVHGRGSVRNVLLYQAEAFKFYSIHQGRYHSTGRALITLDDRLLVDGSAWMGPRPFDNLVFSRFKLGRIKHLAGRTFLLGGWDNYYHYLTENLASFVALETLGQSWADFDHVLVSLPVKPFQKELLQLMDIPREKIRYLEEHDHFQCEQLCYASGNHYLTPHHVDCLRAFFERTILRTNTERGLRLYISRSNKRGGIENEADLWQFLKNREFHKVILDEETMTKQICLFRSRALVVAPHGAGLTNVLFMPKGGKVLKLRNPFFQTYTADAYFRLSSLSSHLYGAFYCQPTGPPTYRSDPAQSWSERPRSLYVEVDKFAEFLDKFLENRLAE